MVYYSILEWSCDWDIQHCQFGMNYWWGRCEVASEILAQFITTGLWTTEMSPKHAGAPMLIRLAKNTHPNKT